MYASALPREIRSSEICVEINRKPDKLIHDIINCNLMASCVRSICAKNWQNVLIGFQVTVENVGDVFLGHSVEMGRLSSCHEISGKHFVV